MAFSIFYNSTTAYANEVYDNFIYIGSGDLLPISPNTSMAASSSTYDLGSSSYKWNNIFCDHIDGSIDRHGWQLITEGYVPTLASAINIVSNFDIYNEMMIIGFLGDLIFNGDSGNNYFYSTLRWLSTALSYIGYGSATTTSIQIADISYIRCKANTNKNCTSIGQFGTLSRVGYYTDNSTTITSITITSPSPYRYYGIYGR